MKIENNMFHKLFGRNTIENQKSFDKPGAELMSADSFNDFRTKNGFTEGRRGTLYSKDRKQFLYVKRCFELKDEKQSENSLTALKYLGSLGIFQPDTEFIAYRNKEKNYQIVPIMRKLEEFSFDKNGKDGRQKALYTGNAERSDNLLSDGSHIKEWLQRIPGNENIANEMPPDNLVNIINVFEALHLNNWGWDTDGKLYPVDVEVISLNDDHSQNIINKWAQDNG